MSHSSHLPVDWSVKYPRLHLQVPSAAVRAFGWHWRHWVEAVPKHLRQVFAQVMHSAVFASQDCDGQLHEYGATAAEGIEPAPQSVHSLEFGPEHLLQEAWQSWASPLEFR